MGYRKTFAALVAVAAFAALVPSAHATLALRLSDGMNTLTVVDGGIGDVNAAAGQVTFIGSVGAFYINVSTALGDQATPYMGIHMDSVNGSFGAGTLIVAMSETNLDFGTSGPTGVVSKFGGIAGGNIRGQMFVDDNNLLFSQASSVFDSGVIGSGAFASSGWSQPSLTDTFSITMLATITHGARGGVTSFNADASVPEPGTLGLVGAALIGLVTTARRRRSNC